MPTIAFDILPSTIIQQTFIDERLITEQELVGDTLKLPSDEKSYLIKLICHWEDDAFNGSMTYTLKLQMDLPLQFQIVTDEIYPGDLIIIKADYAAASDTLAAESTLFNHATFYPYEEGYAALIPTNCYDLPSDYTITLKAMNTEGSVITQEDYNIKLLEKEFEVQYLTATTSMTSINTADNAAHDQVYFDESKRSPIPEKLWEGLFIQPAEGRISTEYGVIRYTNDNPKPRRHYGIDFANKTGTPIAASNTGVVKLSMELITTGNTIVIDHGMGLYTTYMHMDSLLVEQGQSVTKGDMIGTIGTTGYSTGPHLHFSVWKDGVFLNPWTLFDQEIFLEATLN